MMQWGALRNRLMSLVIAGLAIIAWWVYPLIRPQGVYGGHYRVIDIELGAVAIVVWAGMLAVAASPQRLRRRAGIRVGTALGASLFTLAICDLVVSACAMKIGGRGLLEIRSSDTLSDPELHWKHRPGLVWKGRKTSDCQDIDFRTDENGFRNPMGVKAADLVFIGDSVTEAGEVRDEQTFAQGTATALGRSAVNLGVFSYGPQQELVVLKRYGLAYRPRTVVWQVTEWNDLADAERYSRGLPPPTPSQTWFALYEARSPVVGLIRRVFPPQAKFLVDFQRSDGAVDQRTVRPFCNFARGQTTGLEEMRRALVEASALCRERGINFVILYVPDHPRVLAPYVVTHGPADEFHYRPPGGLDRPDDFAHALAGLCQELGCAFVDVTPDLRRRATEDNRHIYVKNDTHLDVDGHDEIVKVLAARLGSKDTLASDPKVRAIK